LKPEGGEYGRRCLSYETAFVDAGWRMERTRVRMLQTSFLTFILKLHITIEETTVQGAE